MVRTAAAYDEGPIAFRYPRGNGVGVDMPERGADARDRQGPHRQAKAPRSRCSPSARGCRIACSPPRSSTPPASRRRSPMRASPSRSTTIWSAGSRAQHEVLITVEEGAIGGFASHVLQFLAHEGLLDTGLKVRPLVLPDVFTDQAKPEKMYADAGLDAPASCAPSLPRWASAARAALGLIAFASPPLTRCLR